MEKTFFKIADNSGPGLNLPALHDHIFARYLHHCLIDAHGKTSLLGFHQVPQDPGQIELLQTFCEADSYDYPMILDPPKQDQHVPSIDKYELDMLTGYKVPQHKASNVTVFLHYSREYFA